MTKQLRKSGINIIGDFPWGTHFCQFYQPKEDLIDILVPYFKAGLENNEYCMWITSEPLKVEEAKKSLKKAVKNLDNYIKKGQMEILDYSDWYTKSGSFDIDEVLEGWVKKEKNAIEKGFDGLRLTGNTFWLEKRDWKKFTQYEEEVNSVIGKYKMIAICSYCLDKCGASDIIDVVSNHEFALIRKEGKWKIIESEEQKKVEKSLRNSEKKYHTLFKNMINGFAYCKMLYDENNKPIDWIYLDINDSFEKLTGLKKDIIGKKATEAIPGIKEAHPELFDIYGKAALTGESNRFEINFKPLGIWLDISVYGLKKEYFVTVFDNITERKKTEKELQENNEFNRTLFDYNPIETLVVDIDGKIVDFNKAKRDLGGGQPTRWDVMYKDYASKNRNDMYAELMECIRIGEPKKFPEQAYKEKVLSINIFPFSQGAIITSQDITKRKKAEEEIKKYQYMVESAHDAIFFKDLKNRYIIANNKTLEAFGLSREEIIGKDDYELMPNKEEAKKNVEDDQLVFKTGKPTEIIKHMTGADGKEYWFQAVKVPQFDNNGNITGLVGIARDITEQKKAEEKLKESEEKYRALIENSPSFIHILQDGMLKYVNSSMCKALGWTFEEITLPSFNFMEKIIPQRFRTLLKEKIAKSLRGESVPRYEIALKTRNDSEIPVIVFAQLTAYQGKTATEVIHVDITERKKAEEMLKQERNIAQQYLDIAGVMFVVINRKGEVTLINKKGCEILDYNEEEILGKNWFENFLPERIREEIITVSKKLFAGEVKTLEYCENPVLTRQGEERIIAWHNTIVKDEEGNIIGYLSSGVDITEHKRMEKMLIQSEKMASIGTLAAGVAHEINNPMGYIYSNLKILLKYYEKNRNFYTDIQKLIEEQIKDKAIIDKFLELKKDAKIDKIITDMKDATVESIEGAEKIIKIVSNLREYAWEEKPKIKTVDINQTIERALNIIWNKLKYKTEVKREFGDIPEIECDLRKLEQVFINILGNAADSIKEQEIIKIKTFSTDDSVIIQISDTGKGIPKEEINRIFDPFYTTKAPDKGIGLGLPISNRIIKDHNGKIFVESEVGKGTTFTIELPVKIAETK